eukprot:Em0005g81a
MLRRQPQVSHDLLQDKRKVKTWEENDYYDSDEDNFLDRTGEVEKKRRQRMRRVGKAEDVVENYQSLMTKLSDVQKQIATLEDKLEKAKAADSAPLAGDTLDTYMTHVDHHLDSTKQAEFKHQVHELKKEEERLKKLACIAKPATIPSSLLTIPITHLPTSCEHLPIPTSCEHLPIPTLSCDYLIPTSCDYLPILTSSCEHLPIPTSSCHPTPAPPKVATSISKDAPPLVEDRTEGAPPILDSTSAPSSRYGLTRKIPSSTKLPPPQPPTTLQAKTRDLQGTHLDPTGCGPAPQASPALNEPIEEQDEDDDGGGGSKKPKPQWEEEGLTIAHGFLLMVRCHGYDSRHISSVLSSPDQHGDADEKPDVSYADIGGMDIQKQEMREAVELPLTQFDLYKQIGIDPPRGVLMYGPPGCGKTMLAKAVAHHTTGRMPLPSFIDEIDAIATKRFDAQTGADREVQRILLELLNQMDGFDQHTNVKVIMATNRHDTLDPALLRPGRLDRKIEFPMPDRRQKRLVFSTITTKMNISDEVDLEDYVARPEKISGADINAICQEAGMHAVRENRYVVLAKDFEKAYKKAVTKEDQEHDFYK